MTPGAITRAENAGADAPTDTPLQGINAETLLAIIQETHDNTEFLREDRERRIEEHRKTGAKNQEKRRKKIQESDVSAGFPGETKDYETRKEEAFKRVANMKLSYGEKKKVYSDEGMELGLRGPDFGREFRRWRKKKEEEERKKKEKRK